MLATCTLVLVVEFSRDRNHGISQTELSGVVLILVAVYKRVCDPATR